MNSPNSIGRRFQVAVTLEGPDVVRLQSMSAMPLYKNHSHEEIRWFDFLENNKVRQSDLSQNKKSSLPTIILPDGASCTLYNQDLSIVFQWAHLRE